jgi:hypothetical protein
MLLTKLNVCPKIKCFACKPQVVLDFNPHVYSCAVLFICFGFRLSQTFPPSDSAGLPLSRLLIERIGAGRMVGMCPF